MHASIWKFAGDPDDLLPRYEAAIAEIPRENMRLHVCLRAQDGIVLIDTCTTKDAFDGFVCGTILALLAKSGLPEPAELDDYPVHVAYVDGAVRG